MLPRLAMGEPDATQRQLTLADGTDIPVEVYGSGNGRVLWLPSEYGFQRAEREAAAALGRGERAVWLADTLEGYLLPPVASSIDAMPEEPLAGLLARARGPGPLYLVSAGRGAVTALRSARAWQRKHPHSDALGGAVLLYPNLYVETPPPGEPARYVPVVDATRMRIVILQSALSPWRWWLDRLAARLEAAGSRVEVRVLEGIRDRFYFRPDATEAETAMGERLAALIGAALDRLGRERAGE